jgi:hypothetical protein
MSIIALITTAKTCKEPKCPLMKTWIKKIGNGILFSYKEGNPDICPMCMTLEDRMLSKTISFFILFYS